ncbi:MAG: radical SAM protein [archaeon]
MRIKRYSTILQKYIKLTKKRSLPKNVQISSNLANYFTAKKKTYCKNKPISAQIEPTLRCNLRCKMCFRDKFACGDMSFEQYKEVLNKLNKVVKLHLQGLGEPFLHKDIFKMIDYAANKGIIVTATSNGTMFSPKIIEQLKHSKLSELGISVDSTKKELYESIRIGANFDKVKQNIKNLTKATTNIDIFLAVVILKENMEDIPNFVDFAKSLGIKKIIFQAVQSKEDFVENYEKDFNSLVVEDKKLIRSLIGKAKNRGKNLGVNVVYDETVIKCVWPWRNIYVTWQGEVTPCCMVVDPKELKLGNILKQPFNKIWNGEKYRYLRYALLNYKPVKSCEGCILKP